MNGSSAEWRWAQPMAQDPVRQHVTLPGREVGWYWVAGPRTRSPGAQEDEPGTNSVQGKKRSPCYYLSVLVASSTVPLAAMPIVQITAAKRAAPVDPAPLRPCSTEGEATELLLEQLTSSSVPWLKRCTTGST